MQVFLKIILENRKSPGKTRLILKKPKEKMNLLLKNKGKRSI